MFATKTIKNKSVSEGGLAMTVTSRIVRIAMCSRALLWCPAGHPCEALRADVLHALARIPCGGLRRREFMTCPPPQVTPVLYHGSGKKTTENRRQPTQDLLLFRARTCCVLPATQSDEEWWGYLCKILAAPRETLKMREASRFQNGRPRKPR